MTTKILGPFTPNPGTTGNLIDVQNPFQGQGTNPWKALIRNDSPYALMVIAGASQTWLGPYEQDYYELPGAIGTFSLEPIALTTIPGTQGGGAGSVLVTAFDQSSDYDGVFPTALTPPSLAQTVAQLASGTLQNDLVHTPVLVASGQIPQNFASILVKGSFVGTYSGALFDSPFMATLDVIDSTTEARFTDCKGCFKPKGGLPGNTRSFLLATAGVGDTWQLTTLQPLISPFGHPEPGAFTFQYTVYGITIMDPDTLLLPGTINTLTDGGYSEPDVIGALGSKIKIGLEYDGETPQELTLVEFYADGPATSGLVLARQILDVTIDTVPWKKEIITPSHAAWALGGTSGLQLTAAVC